MQSSLPYFPQPAAPGAAMLRSARPLLLVVAAHMGLLWLATSMHVAPPAAVAVPVPPAVMLAVLEAAPQPAQAPAPQPVRTVPLLRPQPHPKVAPLPTPVSAAPSAVTAPAAPVPASAAPAAAAEPVAPASPALPAPAAPARPALVTSGVQYLIPPQPVYPAAARRRGDEGEVLLRVLINAQGGVEHIALERSSGIASLDQAAREAVARARFQPYVEQGRAQPAYVVVPIKFQLNQ
ncbi:energy transducer TonB [Herbaspirillum sp. DW155]|uniref:energy transducer TonB n=1 Tax=Herbaspirillum sp. DW155 TaxID=3095609 RepID=UPI0030915FBF|nr:energy transducer TonB [Herbaspirillum sp. DW155]